MTSIAQYMVRLCDNGMIQTYDMYRSSTYSAKQAYLLLSNTISDKTRKACDLCETIYCKSYIVIYIVASWDKKDPT